MESAAVPEDTAEAFWKLLQSINCCSNLSTKGPTEDTNSVSIHSLRYFFSLPEIFGMAIG